MLISFYGVHKEIYFHHCANSVNLSSDIMFPALLPPVSLPSLSTLPPRPPALPQLAHDELLLHHRKAHIRSFGSRWLLPPGIPKTLQGLADERAERAEAEAQAAAQEEAQQRQEEAEAAMMEGEEGIAGEEGEEMGMDEDLDREVVDMDDEGEDEDLDSDDEDIEEDDEEAQWEDEPPLPLTTAPPQSSAPRMNPMSAAHSSFLDEETGMDMGVDLDGDIPSAPEEEGSYQHTDTDVEDESSIFETGQVVGGRQGVLDSSVFGRDSPGRVPAASQTSASAAVAAREAAMRRMSGRRSGGMENARRDEG